MKKNDYQILLEYKEYLKQCNNVVSDYENNYKFWELDNYYQNMINFRNYVSKEYQYIFKNVEQINNILLKEQLGVLKILLFFSSADCYMLYVRSVCRKISSKWLERNIPDIIDEVLNLENERDYKGLIALLEVSCPQLLLFYIKKGLYSNDEDIKHLAEDFIEEVEIYNKYLK